MPLQVPIGTRKAIQMPAARLCQPPGLRWVTTVVKKQLCIRVNAYRSRCV